MRCPFCKLDNDRVIDSRGSDDNTAIRRRRQCLNCKRRFTTYERIEERVVRVVKKNEDRVPFNAEKVRAGLEKACWKRPVATKQIDDIVKSVTEEVMELGADEIDSQTVGEIVMRHLADVDQVAFVRFASVYRQFKGAEDFLTELKQIGDPSKRTT